MTNADVVLAVVDWIEERLSEGLAVPDLAARAGYSLHHFVRLFHGVVGLSPRDYIVRRRLTEAASRIAQSSNRITDIALDGGFNDVETFTRAFRREMGCTPTAVRRGTAFPCTPRFTGRALEGRSGISIPPVLEHVAPFLIAGWCLRVGEDTSSVGKLWHRFLSRAPSIPNVALPLRFLQLAAWTEEDIEIMTGVEVIDLLSLPVDLAGRSVPESDCLVFTHRGSVRTIDESYRSIYRDWLPPMERKPALSFNFERYPDSSVDPWSEGYELQICVPVQ